MFIPLDTREPPRSPIHLKNLMDEAREKLGGELEPPVLDRMLSPARRLLDAASRLKGSGTLALFLEPSGERGRYLLDHAIEPQVYVGDRFLLRPLTEAADREPFVVLCLSQQFVRAYASARGKLVEIQPDELPRHGVEDIPGADADHNELQQHVSGHRSQAIHHGHRDDTHGEDELLSRLCQRIAQALRSTPPRPVVVAATDRIAALFAGHAKGLVIAGTIRGNHENTALPRLYDQANELMQARRRTRDAAFREDLEAAIAQGRGAKDLKEVVMAAFDGQVDTLFVDAGATRWGTMDPGTRTVEVHSERRDGDDDLIDMAVHLTLRHGGDIIPFVPLDAAKGAATIHRHA